jgi:hypothetical protein
MVPTHAFKRGQKLLKLYSISKILSMRASVKLQGLVSKYTNVPKYQKLHLKRCDNLNFSSRGWEIDG